MRLFLYFSAGRVAMYTENTETAKMLFKALEGLILPVIAVNRTGGVVFLNSSAVNIIGDGALKLQGTSIKDVFDAHTIKRLEELVAEPEKEQPPLVSVLEIDGKKKSFKFVLSAYPKGSSPLFYIMSLEKDSQENTLSMAPNPFEPVNKLDVLFRDVFSRLPLAVYARDVTGKMVFINKKTLEINGQPSDAGTDYPEFISKEKIKEYIERDLEILRRGNIAEFIDEDPDNPNYARRYTRLIKFPLYDKGLRPLMVLTVQEEDTASLRTVLENLPFAVFAKKYDGNIFLWNKKCETLFGIEAKDVILKSGFFPGDSAYTKERVAEQEEEIFTSGKPLEIAQEIISVDKKIKLLHTIKTPVYNKDGSPAILICVFEEISSLKKSEREAQDKKDLYLSVIENARDGVVILKDGIVSYINAPLLSALSYNAGEVLSREIYSFTDAGSAVGLREVCAEIKSKETAKTPARIIFVSKNREKISFEVTGFLSKRAGQAAEVLFLRKL